MKNKFKFSNSSIYFKMFLALTLVITIITSSLPIVYSATDTTNTVNALSNPSFESGSGSWIKSSGNVTIKANEGINGTNALELTDKDNDNAVYQTVTKSDGSDFLQGSTFKWEFNFKSTTTNDIVALVLGTSVPSGDSDQFRQMITWLKNNNKVNKNIPTDGQYQVIVYSKPFGENGDFKVHNYDDGIVPTEHFSLTPTMYFTEKWTVIFARTNTENWKNISNPATTPFTLVKDSSSITYSLLSYSGDVFVDDVSFLIETPGKAVEHNNLQNGSFENLPITATNAYYAAVSPTSVKPWKTTATDQKIELFKTVSSDGNNTNTQHFQYPKKGPIDRTLPDPVQAAELNAEQSSSLYQYIKTESGSQYKWKLSHRGRLGADIMALVIGPKQSVNPGKPSPDRQDQFMQMVEWVKEEKNLKEYSADVQDDIKAIEYEAGRSELQASDYKCTPVKVTVYSKPFDKNGGFVSPGSDTYFSATESTEFSQKWDITIICSGNVKWYTYGANDDDMYSYYEVPEGQTDSIFAFTAYKSTDPTGVQEARKNTHGNMLDDINFDLYHPASSVSFTGGDAKLFYVYKGKLSDSELKSGEPAQPIMVDDNSTFTLDVTPSISTKTVLDKNGNAVLDENGNVKTEPRLDANKKPIQNTFLGAYITIDGQRKYYPATAINSTDNAVYFSETTEIIDGIEMTVYHYGQSNVSGRVVVELVYSEVYTMIYNSKGGKEYSVRYNDAACYPNTSHMDWKGSNANIARFYEKASCTYTSTDCDWWEDNPNVIFKGWELVGGTIYKLPETENGEKIPVSKDEKVLFRGNATVTYNAPTIDDIDPKLETETEIESAILEEARKRDFIINDGIYEGRVNAYGGGVLVANWEYKTSVIAQTEQLDGSFKNSGVGGQVRLADHTTEVTDITNVVRYPENDGILYPTTTDANGNTVSKPIDYTDAFTFASAFNNVVKASQQKKAGYKFLGWYDENGIKLSATSDHSFTIVPYFSNNNPTTNPTTAYQSPKVVYARFGFEYKVKFHINDSDTVSTVGNPDADLYRVYYPEGVDISQASSLNLNYKILHLDSNNKIQDFYDLPDLTIPDPKANPGKIFMGWYRDKANETDKNPIKWNSDYKTDTDIYAHWLDVGTVPQDKEDKKIIDPANRPFVNEKQGSNNLLWGFDLSGVQIRYQDKDDNYPGGTVDIPAFTTDGLRFVTYLKEDILTKTSDLFKEGYTGYKKIASPIRYGYVVATEKTADSILTNGESLEYKDFVIDPNKKDKYSFVTNADCTSMDYNPNSKIIKDHGNFPGAYRIYSLIISYNASNRDDSVVEDAKSQNIIARPYLRYQDANGLYRTYYQDYTGNAEKHGGCSTNYTATREYLENKSYFPTKPTTAPAN